MKCLIIAAGKGMRIRARGESKPLVSLRGVPLIEWVMRSAMRGGVTEFLVVTGYNGAKVRACIEGFSARAGVPVTPLENPRWEEPNGLSVLAARPALHEPFILTMCDHLVEPSLIAGLIRDTPAEGETILAVDYNLQNPWVDLDDVTRVREEGGLIRDIGKGLAAYNAFDTGVFHATPAQLDAIEQSAGNGGDASLSGGMRVLAATNRARVHDVQGARWLDVDEPVQAALAERFCGRLIRAARSIPGFFPASYPG